MQGTLDDIRQREVHALVARAGLPAARFHTLRHARGALLVAQGVHLQVIADILGHSDIRVTSAVYAPVGEQRQRDAAERMASALEWEGARQSWSALWSRRAEAAHRLR